MTAVNEKRTRLQQLLEAQQADWLDDPSCSTSARAGSSSPRRWTRWPPSPGPIRCGNSDGGTWRTVATQARTEWSFVPPVDLRTPSCNRGPCLLIAADGCIW